MYFVATYCETEKAQHNRLYQVQGGQFSS